MEGLDLFTPSVQEHSVSSDSGSDFESGDDDDDDYQVGSGLTQKRAGLCGPGGVGEVVDRTRDFEIEKVLMISQVNQL